MINTKTFIIFYLLLSGYFSFAQARFDVSLLQGAWWDARNPTMPLFIIAGDSLYHIDKQQPNLSVQASGNQIILKNRYETKTLTVSKLTTDSLIAYDVNSKESLRFFKTPGAHQTIELGSICSTREKGYRAIADYIILVNYKASMLTDHDCVLDIIDKLARVPVFRNMEALDIFASKSDDYVKEKMIVVAMKILRGDPEGILLHVSTNRDALFNSLINGLSRKLSSEKISKDALKSEITSKLSDDVQRKTLDEIFEKVEVK
ncbi:MAG: hypothetical protein WDO15_15805 [Bacteroidota bacterium]